MARTRLRSAKDPLSTLQQAALDDWCRRICAWPPRSPERGALTRECMAALDLGRSTVYGKVKAYESPDDPDAGGPQALQRKPRRDAGHPRAGAGAALADAKRLAQWGYDEEAERVRAEARRAARELKASWLKFVGERSRVHQKTTVLRAAFAEAHPEWAAALPGISTLRNWRRERAPHLDLTQRELEQAVRIGHRVEALYANHCWQADQHTADVEVRAPIVDPHTGEITGERLFRPYLFYFLDRFTGLIMGGGYYERYDTACVEAAWLDSVYPAPGRPWCGVPRIIYWDNGRQHWSHWTGRTAASLGTELIASTACEPTAHGFIEGAHGIAVRAFEATLPGYTGKDSLDAHRPLARRIEREERHEIEPRLTLAQLNEQFLAFVIGQAEAPYRDGPSRLARYQMSVLEDPQRRAVPNRERLGWAFMHADHRKVDQEGFIQFERRVYVLPPHMGHLCGRKVEIRFLWGDASAIHIADGRGQWLCTCGLRTPLIIGHEGSRQVAATDRKEARRSARVTRAVARDLDVLAGLGALDPETAAASGKVLQAAASAMTAVNATELAAARKSGAPADHRAPLVRLLPEPDERPLADDPDPRGREFLVAVVASAAEAVSDDRRPEPGRRKLFDL